MSPQVALFTRLVFVDPEVGLCKVKLGAHHGKKNFLNLGKRLTSDCLDMRSVSFVQRLEIDLPGNLFTHALALGDIDNDQINEFVVGNVNGLLCIYKGMSTQPWRLASGLGMVTCVGIGDVCNKGKNFLVCLSGEGWCNIFNVTEVKPRSDQDASKQDGQEKVEDDVIIANHVQHIPANTKMLLIHDIDNDGQCELVVGHTDRMVRAYRWVENTPTETVRFTAGHFVLLQQWYLPGQFGSLSVNIKSDGSSMLIVSQPGCNYVELVCVWKEDVKDNKDQNEQHVIYHPISTTRARNPGVSTEIVGHISRGTESGKDNLYALCTLDGTLMLVADDKIQWSHLVDHQLFALSKLDITGDGKEEVIACAWDGQTYIVDHNKHSVRFHFEENVSAFCAGYYGVDGHNNATLVYATFKNRIYLYWNVQLPMIPSSSLLDVMAKDESVQRYLNDLDIDSTDTCKLRTMYHQYIYGQSSSNG
uniref:Integrin-alpha FG-GAP repeat-containing protein 2-like n=1 Tax=Saccoglossus kowalevskii TaxID=10224 RepID=A0ABM0MNY7_SACKO|nr:PREDICTED: integrin-alpha FG-GAP repeat-containing protein 2-like [Saccoglossus kowalevskii]